jgi:hypothetical protein
VLDGIPRIRPHRKAEPGREAIGVSFGGKRDIDCSTPCLGHRSRPQIDFRTLVLMRLIH